MPTLSTLPDAVHSLVLESMAEGVTLIASATCEVVYANRAAEAMFGFPPGQMVGQPAAGLSGESTGEHERRFADIRAALDAAGVWSGEFRTRRRDGTDFLVHARISTLMHQGQVYRLCVQEDITQRKHAEQALGLSEQRLRQVMEADMLGFLAWDANGEVFEANDAFLRMLGYSREDLQCGRIRWDEMTPAEYAALDAAALEQLRETGRCDPFEKEYVRRDGTRVPILIGASVLERGDGRGVSFVLDLTRRKQAEQEVRAIQNRFQAFMDHSHAVAFMKDAEGRYIYLNRPFLTRFPHFQENWLGRTDADLWPDDLAAQFRDNDRTVMERGEPLRCIERTHEEGSERIWQVFKFPFSDEAGQRCLGGMALDITESVHAQERLTQAEEQVRQGQKMEAVGRLAGGVAHDFNNLLTVINGCSELLLEQLSDAHPGRALAKEIHAAGERAAALTRQLLAFSRRQVLKPKVLDVNDVVRQLEQMLRRVLGPDVEIVMQLATATGLVQVDPAQLDQAIINLAVNARDAMPTGGRLTLVTSRHTVEDQEVGHDGDLVGGDYVRLMICDTGHGMDAETQARVFEPFFSTKEAGKGTGLGLAMVYGFVRQSGGQIRVESQTGEGTRFLIDLPCVASSATPATAPTDRQALPAGTETVLLVDDEEGIRAWASHVLTSCGYRVLEAGHGQAALELAAEQGPIDLLVTDVVMPRMSGRQLADALAAQHPEVRVLFMSGYTDDAVIRRGIMRSTAPFLQKPFSAIALARKVRELLDETAMVRP